MTMSLDGFIADPDDQPGELFDWYQAGEVSVPSANENVLFDVDEASAEVLGDLTDNVGALVAGRRLFDIANGWNDSHPAGARVVVVTHSRPPMRPSGGRRRRSSTTSGRRSTKRRRSPATRASRSPAPTSPSRRSLGLVDEVCVSLVPVLFGEGIPYFAKLDRGHVMFEDPVVVQGRRALHLRFPVRGR